MRKHGRPPTSRKAALTASWSMFLVRQPTRPRQVRTRLRRLIEPHDPALRWLGGLGDRGGQQRPPDEWQNHRLGGGRRLILRLGDLAKLEIVPKLAEPRIARVAET